MNGNNNLQNVENETIIVDWKRRECDRLKEM
jgi:hypothetical protein